MAIKFVSGVPGSGKSYYVMREVILKHFQYNNEFHEWEKKSDSPLNIITNIDGLRLPHISFESHLKEKGISYTQFFTQSYIQKLTEEIGQVIIILDEAQKYFPKSFKEDSSIVKANDFQNSVFYFFEYHRHLDCDVYLMAQLWTRMHPDIVGLCEYQVKAVPRTLSLVGEFRYHLCMGFDVLSRVTIKADKKIFALYQSTVSGNEVKTNQIRPIRKYVLLIAAMIVVALFSARQTFKMLSGDGQQLTVANASVKYADPDKMPLLNKPDSTPSKKAVESLPVATGQELSTASRNYNIFQYVPNDLVKLKCGSFWSGPNLLAIEYFGEMVEPQNFEHPFQADSETKTVTILLPRDVFIKADRVRMSEKFAHLEQLDNNKPRITTENITPTLNDSINNPN